MLQDRIDAAECACAVLRKANEDEDDIDAIVATITGLLGQAWDDAIQLALAELVLRLKELEEGEDEDLAVLDNARNEKERAQVLREFVAALIGSLQDRAGSAATGLEGAILRDQGRRLFQAGSATLGVTDPFQGGSRRSEMLMEAVGRDLRVWQAQRIADRTEKVEALLREYFTNREVRSQVLGLRAIPTGVKPWISRLEDAVADANRVTSGLIVDTWGYRWNRIGEARALELSGVEVAYASNPRDHRTTPFCFWVHGRPVQVRELTRQIDSYVEAINDGDGEAAADAWPLFSWKKADGPDEFLKAWETGGLGVPPYHWRCRTTLVVRAQ